MASGQHMRCVVVLLTTATAVLTTATPDEWPPCKGADCTECVGGPCSPSHQQCGTGRPGPTPQFHITDASCGINDPNGVFWDRTHGMYHVFYQDHLVQPPGVGPVWGHVASPDLVHWTRLPVALWNDKPYDRNMLWSGSAAIGPDGRPVLVYPGGSIVPDWPLPGFFISTAVPEDLDDPWYTNWTKPAANPIINQTQRDPSSVWRTPAGEWRLVTYGSQMFGSMDFSNWKYNGQAPFPGGECPSFFPLPPVSPGEANSSKNGPTHVAKFSIEGWTHDAMQLGRWQDGPPGATGSWTVIGSAAPADNIIDAGDFYASKDLWDGNRSRRINIGWIPPVSALSLPRQLTWHPRLEQLLHSPVDEQAELRGRQLGSLNRSLEISGSYWVGDWPGLGSQLEAVVVFALPPEPAVFGIDVMAGREHDVNSSTRAYIDWTPGARSLNVGVSRGQENLTLISEGPKSSLKLLPEDTTLSLRVFLDQTLVEVYWMDGRTVITSALLGARIPAPGLALFASSKTVVRSLNVWHVNSIWTSAAEALAYRYRSR